MKNNNRQDNYKWHDLKQNPNDLPKDNSEVLVAIYDPKVDPYECYSLVDFVSDLYKFDEISFYKYKNKKECGFIEHEYGYGYFTVDNVVAWKYIEPFNIADNSK